MGRTLVALYDFPQVQYAVEYARSTNSGDEFVLVHVIDYSESITNFNRGSRAD